MTNLHVIIGLGATGLSCARFLAARNIPFALTDSRTNPPNYDVIKAQYPEVTVAVGGLDENLLAEASTIVISPGMALSEPVIVKQLARGVDVVGDIELFAQAVNVPVLAITGTNAKSTVTTLVGKMGVACGYKTQVGGNLGIPALDILDQQPDTELFVLELSSFQLETTHSLNAAVATILNVSPDHMDRYDSFAAYQQAKQKIYQHCQASVCNKDDALTHVEHPNRVWFTQHEPNEGEFGLRTQAEVAYLAFGTALLMPVSDMLLQGKHDQVNALAALAIGHSFGFDIQSMLQVLRQFSGLPHRCQMVRELDGVKWYNDSKGTNVGATIAAIDGLGANIAGKLILIAGGDGKNADFTALATAVAEHVRHVVLIGTAAQDLSVLLAPHAETSRATSMQDAISKAKAIAQPGDSVLLSPACASFDMFKNYEHRGEVYTQAVELL